MATDMRSVDRAFFEDYGKGDPDEAWREWSGWLAARRRSDQGKRRKLLQICSGLSEAAVRHYFAERHHFLGEPSLDRLDRIMEGIGQKPVPRAQIPPAAMPMPRRTNHVALLTQLHVPSESYHLELIRGIVRNTQIHHLATAVHEVSPIDLGSSIERIRTTYRPDGIVLLRLTPSPRDLQRLARMDTPVVLVHADRYRYPRPVVANIIPNQEQLEGDLRAWINRYMPRVQRPKDRASRATHKAVLVRMPQEAPTHSFPLIGSYVEPSIRNDRIARLTQALRDFKLAVEEVPDYRFLHALHVYQSHPDADLYVSLSDQIAVGLKQLLIAAGRPWKQKIVGFDDSVLSKEEQLASFSQSLDTIGLAVVDQLWRFHRTGKVAWPEFQELATDVYLEIRFSTE